MGSTQNARAAADRKLAELLADTNAPLHEDLEDYVREGPTGLMLHHPLMIEVFYVPEFNARINYAYEQKRAMAEKARKAGDWNHYIFLHERPYRWEALHHMRRQTTRSASTAKRKAFWETFAEVYIDTENWYELPQRLWCEQWIDSDRNKYHAWMLEGMMNEDERADYDALPDRITVYRGWHRERGADGWSWTTERGVAEWFAARFRPDGATPQVATGEVEKRHVLAYWTRRKESEVFAHWKHVNVRTIN